MKIFVTLLILLTALVSYGQNEFKTIAGVTTDVSTGEPLPFCSVYINNEAIGTVSNQIGEFTLNVPVWYLSDSLVVSHIGYQNFYGIVNTLPGQLVIKLEEASLELEKIEIKTQSITAAEIFGKAIERIQNENGYPSSEFRLDAFYREHHTSNGENVAVVESAVEIYDKSVTKKMKDVVIAQFRKAFDKRKKEVLNDWSAGRNHLLLVLNGGINIVPLASGYKKSIWGKANFEIEKVTYFDDRLVYILLDKPHGNELRLIVDAEDYSIYKSEFIMQVKKEDHEHYFWQEVNTEGERCGAILDHQAYEYRKVNGVMFPYYFYRKQDFRCFDLINKIQSSQSYFSKELLINSVQTGDIPKASPDRLKMRKGFINYNEPYDTAFWRYFNDIQEVSIDEPLTRQSFSDITPKNRPVKSSGQRTVKSRPLRIGNHRTYEFSRADTLYGSLTPFLSCYDAVHYDLDVAVDPDDQTVSGTSGITFKVLEQTGVIRIDLFEYLKINSIKMDNIDLKFTRDMDLVYIEFDEPLLKDHIYSVTVDYEGRPLDLDFEIFAGAFIWSSDESDNPFIQSICQGYGPKGWWPVKNHISDEPDSATINITVPRDLIPVSNGVLINVDSIENAQVRYSWRVSNPINNYDIAVHIGNYETKSEFYRNANGDTLKITYFFLKQDRELAIKKLAMVPKMLKVYEKYFGPYPFPEDGFKIVQSLYPMEHQSCVAVGQYFDEGLILHETAHEWWGNSVSCADNADIWIHEAFATYAESLYIEEILGYELGQEYLNSRKSKIHNDHPLVGIKNVNHFYYRIDDKYFKGALMLNTLRHLVNDDKLWFEALKGIQKEFRHSFINTAALTDYLNAKLKSDYSEFFYQYLYTTRIPILAIQNAGERSLQYRWNNTGENFNMAIEWDGKFISPTREWKSTETGPLTLEDIPELEKKYLLKIKME